MSEITRVGADLAKRVIQVHAVDATGKLVTNRPLQRDKFIAWCAATTGGLPDRHGGQLQRPPLGPQARGLGARMPASSPPTWWHLIGCRAKPARTTPTMPPPFAKQLRAPPCASVSIKTLAQQSMLCVHRLREGFKQERTACVNRIRGLLAEFGVVLAPSPKALREVLNEVIEDASNALSGLGPSGATAGAKPSGANSMNI